MKATLYDTKGKKKSEIEMPKIFDQKVREDIVAKYFEMEKFIQPYSPGPESGKRHSASGTISHQRHRWGGHYGKGISRIPRKTMWKRGTQFFWIGAEVASVRGGRRAHPPKGIGKEKRLNKKETKIAFGSGFAATCDSKWIMKRYETLKKMDSKVPVVIESKIDGMKTKDMIVLLKSIFGEAFGLVLKKKELRSGKGSRRGRKYKSTAGLLLVKGSDEKIKMKGIEIKDTFDVKISDLYPLGRLTVYTEKALAELGKEEK
ncbi:50S ribosomal protein L4 [Candidatus Pacearchaeota archaeon CG_4_9_14_0_2_um_filter_39_13]|nr:50S ribosomal protein L4 [Candidatus Pacearchaeota archaeon]OIO44073.1 MAG: 50S ribosomal protein L4 [Candidatus Pacearchaeota archaeon CG1_02_39_14]PJC44363.1 MAG: 50S ribosomal protein L4 [Candidatus Pacearchaeota archaeon CG_4_9_14_0_2_um_filter_39_13]